MQYTGRISDLLTKNSNSGADDHVRARHDTYEGCWFTSNNSFRSISQRGQPDKPALSVRYLQLERTTKSKLSSTWYLPNKYMLQDERFLNPRKANF